ARIRRSPLGPSTCSASTRATESSRWDSGPVSAFGGSPSRPRRGGWLVSIAPRRWSSKPRRETPRRLKRVEVELREGAVERLPFEDETFNRALVVNSMQVWPDVVGGLREIRRVMKPGGRVALAFTRHSGQPTSGLTDALTAAGFSGVRVAEREDGFCALATKPRPK